MENTSSPRHFLDGGVGAKSIKIIVPQDNIDEFSKP